MALLDDLKGLLSPAEFAKIEGNQTIATRLTRGDELRSFYDGEEPPPVQQQQEPPPVQRQAPPGTGGAFDLSAIERMFDARMGKLNETVDARVAEVVKTRGDELVNNAVKIAVQRADELSRVYSRHERETGKPFDSADFNTYLEKPEVKALGFRTITQAYESYIAPVAQAKIIADAKAEGAAAARAEDSGKHVPGTTPGPAVNSNIRHFQSRTATGAAAENTGAGRAAAALDKIMNRRNESAA